MPLTDLFNKLVVLQEFDVVFETMQIINANSEFIAELLRGQLRKGKDGEGNTVTIFGRDYYTDATVFEKERHGVGFGKFTEWITNYMFGTFYNSIRTKIVGDTFEQVSDVDYFPEIINRSGSVIMELDATSLQTFSEQILIPQLQERFSLRFNAA